MTADGPPSGAPPQEAPNEPVPPPTGQARDEREPIPFTAEAWGRTARATVLFILLGMSLLMLVRLGLADDWIHGFLRRNRISMEDRMMLIYQMCGVGGLLGLLCLVRAMFSKDGPEQARMLEGWAWFLSPLILLPAIPVTLEHSVWRGRHEDLLPVVLFGGMLLEFFLLKSYVSVPAPVTKLYEKVFGPEEKEKAPTSPKPGQDQSRPPVGERLLSFVEDNGPLITVVAAALLYGAFMSFYTIRWHHKLGTATFDLGINNNLLYGGLHGKFNQSTVIFPEDPQKYLANHVKIGLYTFLPIYALYPKAETLLTIQSVSLGLGAIPLFLFAKKRIPHWWAAALALCYLAYYPMHGANFYEMKVVPTTAAIVLLCIWAIDDKRWILGGITFVWALIMREDMPVPLAVVGGVFLLSGHRPIAGALMAGLGTIWFVLLRFRFMNEVGSWWFPNMYEDLWAAPETGFQGVIKTLVSNPTYTLKHIFVEKKFWYLMHLLVPLMFVPLRRWYGWAAMVPGAILTLLVTDYAPPTLFSFQYVMHWSPYLFIATAVVLSDFTKGPSGHARAFAALGALCMVSAALSYNYGAFSRRDKALKSGYHKIEFSFSEKEAKEYAEVRRLVASIPKNASVGTTEHIGPHLSSRVGFYTLRRGSHGVDYIVACEKGLKLDRTKRTVRDALSNKEYGVVGRYGTYVVLKRGADTSKNEELIDEWRLESKSSKRRSKKRTNGTNSGEDSDDSENEDDSDEDDSDKNDSDQDAAKKESDADENDPQTGSDSDGDGDNGGKDEDERTGPRKPSPRDLR